MYFRLVSVQLLLVFKFQLNLLSIRFPPSKYLVYAFQGAPGDYPSLKVNQYIQKYIEFSKLIHRRSDEYIANELKNEVFVAVHLRNGGDMVNIVWKFTAIKNQLL